MVLQNLSLTEQKFSTLTYAFRLPGPLILGASTYFASNYDRLSFSVARADVIVNMLTLLVTYSIVKPFTLHHPSHAAPRDNILSSYRSRTI
ncbi:hypothetical protein K503DRAFT_775955 [Rhizopogon vinicolor AM-OR11-026]|uniref:Uncharacterized protein n=1 Tax=Rhizopogon vinicolor AM-OR11-026 TaxID=1314800 RepID=A0A1B7MKK1_9AGAM|nr:hypothetical protein K503DRAFT_775955 [Rhizopogon vinicolor AM-OR11-026]